jgi:hypothetical protein
MANVQAANTDKEHVPTTPCDNTQQAVKALSSQINEHHCKQIKKPMAATKF